MDHSSVLEYRSTVFSLYRVQGTKGKLWTEFFSFFHGNKEGKNENPYLAERRNGPSKREANKMCIICLC